MITGGPSGMGLATAKLLSNEGARVLVTGRTSATLLAAQTDLGDDAIVVASDASSLAEIDDLAIRVKDSLGELDLLFLHADVGPFVPFAEVTEASTTTYSRSTRRALLHGPKTRTPDASRRRHRAHDVHRQRQGMPMISVYAASTAALRSMARTLAAELQPRGIRVNAVTPGPITTPILDKSGLPDEAIDEFHDQMQEGTVLKRRGDPDEVARAAAFLAFLALAATYTPAPNYRSTANSPRFDTQGRAGAFGVCPP